ARAPEGIGADLLDIAIGGHEVRHGNAHRAAPGEQPSVRGDDALGIGSATHRHGGDREVQMAAMQVDRDRGRLDGAHPDVHGRNVPESSSVSMRPALDWRIQEYAPHGPARVYGQIVPTVQVAPNPRSGARSAAAV